MIGQHRHRVTLETPGDLVPDGDGGYISSWTSLDPPDWDCAITPATVRDMERQAAGAVMATATHLVRGRYHPGITTETRLTFEGRIFEVQSVQNPDERQIDTLLLCAEQLGVTG